MTSGKHWVGTWATAPAPAEGASFANQTLRMNARVSIGGQVRTMTTAVGYASSSHAGVHFGLGRATAPVTVRVEWPSGVKQVIENVGLNRVAEIREPK